VGKGGVMSMVRRFFDWCDGYDSFDIPVAMGVVSVELRRWFYVRLVLYYAIFATGAAILLLNS